MVPVKQNWFREHGEVPMIFTVFPEMKSDFDEMVEAEAFGERKDPSWVL